MIYYQWERNNFIISYSHNCVRSAFCDVFQLDIYDKATDHITMAKIRWEGPGEVEQEFRRLPQPLTLEDNGAMINYMDAATTSIILIIACKCMHELTICYYNSQVLFMTCVLLKGLLLPSRPAL